MSLSCNGIKTQTNILISVRLIWRNNFLSMKLRRVFIFFYLQRQAGIATPKSKTKEIILRLGIIHKWRPGEEAIITFMMPFINVPSDGNSLCFRQKFVSLLEDLRRLWLESAFTTYTRRSANEWMNLSLPPSLSPPSLFPPSFSRMQNVVCPLWLLRQ